jgi:hypothetical protein
MNFKKGLVGLIAGTAMLVGGALNARADEPYKILREYGFPKMAKDYLAATYPAFKDIREQVAKRPGKTIQDKKDMYIAEYAAEWDEMARLIQSKDNIEEGKAKIANKNIEILKKYDKNVKWSNTLPVMNKRIDAIEGLVRYMLEQPDTKESGEKGFDELMGRVWSDQKATELFKRYLDTQTGFDLAVAGNVYLGIFKVPMSTVLNDGTIDKLRRAENEANISTLHFNGKY